MKSRIPSAVLTVIAAGLALPALASTGSWSFESSKVTNGEFPIRRACIMPAEGKLTKIGMKGGESMSKESDDWNTALQNLVEGHLKSAGVEFGPALGTGASGAPEDEVRQVVNQIEEKYNGLEAKINRHPKDIAKSRYTLGDEVALLPCAANADVIVFVRGQGQVVTGGKATMSLFVGGPIPAATLILTMADAKTGEILAFARLVNVEGFGSKFMEDSEKVYGPGLDKQFKRLHIGEYQGKK